MPYEYAYSTGPRKLVATGRSPRGSAICVVRLESVLVAAVSLHCTNYLAVCGTAPHFHTPRDTFGREARPRVKGRA